MQLSLDMLLSLIDPTTVALCLLGYLAGSIPSAVLVCNSMGMPDPRQHGSGNPGASNVLRLAGKSAAFFTLLGDTMKGAATLAIAATQLENGGLTSILVATWFGHVYPIFDRQHGGKGVATLWGGCLVLSPLLALLQAAVWTLSFATSRVSAVASITTAIISPLLAWLIAPALTTTMLIMTPLILFTHRSNIKRLISQQENRF